MHLHHSAHLALMLIDARLLCSQVQAFLLHVIGMLPCICSMLTSHIPCPVGYCIEHRIRDVNQQYFLQWLPAFPHPLYILASHFPCLLWQEGMFVQTVITTVANTICHQDQITTKSIQLQS